MTRLLLIADDFTGSLDTGVQFAKRGIDTLVTVMRDQPVDLRAACQVLVVNTESRHATPEEAYRRVASLAAEAAEAGFTHIYKKTDSTLRGNIGSELAAVLESVAEDELVFIPAFPKSGRFTIQGNQFVGETLLAETAFANDPFNPVRQSSVAAIIAEQTDLPVDNVFAGQYDRLKTSTGQAKTIRVVDAASDEDLQAIGQSLKDAGKLTLLAGCAGFAEWLPALIGLASSMPSMPDVRGGTLIVSGSVNPMSLKQVQHAFDHCGYASSQLSVDQKIDASHVDTTWENRLIEQLRTGGKVAIWSKRAETAADDAAARADQLGIAAEDLASLIAGNIGTIVKRTLDRAAEEAPIRNLVVFGGDTLLGIADKIGCHLMRPLQEIVPGVVLARFENCRLALNVISKAGGFGGEDVVARIDAFLSVK